MGSPSLEQPLIDKLVQFNHLDPSLRPGNRRFQLEVSLKSAATKVLDKYQSNKEGKTEGVPAKNHGAAAVLRNAVSNSFATFFGSAASWMLNVSGLKKEQGRPNLYRPVELVLATHVEPPHSSGDIEQLEV